MRTTPTISSTSPQEIEWVAVWNIKRKGGQILDKSVVLQEERMSREWDEKWSWRYEHSEAHSSSTIYCTYSLHHNFYIFSWESLQSVNLKTLRRYYSEEMGPGFKWSEYSLSMSYYFFSFISVSLIEAQHWHLELKITAFFPMDETFIIINLQPTRNVWRPS